MTKKRRRRLLQQQEELSALEPVDFYGWPAARPLQVGDSSRPGRLPWGKRDELMKSWTRRRNDGSTKRPHCSDIQRVVESRALRRAS